MGDARRIELSGAEGDLGAAIRLYRDGLPPGALRSFDIGALDRVGLTVFAATFAGEDGYLSEGFGYGATPDEALVGALGELSETTHLDAAVGRMPVEVASWAEMGRRHGAEQVLDPLALCLPAGSDWSPDAPLAWVRLRRWPDGAPGWAPLECVASAPDQHALRAGRARALFPAITCGLGAGTSLEQALSHGVLELLQRDGNCTSFRAMDRGVVVALDRIEDPGLAGLVAHLRGLGIELQVKLASTEFGMANLYAQGTGLPVASPLAQTACGEAVHPNAERALRKALLEFVASRARKAFMHGELDAVRRVAPPGYLEDYVARFDPAAEEERALREMARWVAADGAALVDGLRGTVCAERERVAFSALPTAPEGAARDPARRMADLAARLGAEGVAVWYADVSPHGADGPRVVKAVAPMLEGETMSYHRIGERGAMRLLARGSGIVVRAPGPGRRRIRLTAAAEARLGGPAWLDVAEVNRIVGGAYPLYREPSSHAVHLLRAGLAPRRAG